MGLPRIDTFDHDGRVVVQPHGDVDLATAHEFDAALSDALKRVDSSPRAMVVVHLTDVGFFGSAGLPPLTYRHSTGSERDIDVAVVHTAVVRRVLEVTGLDSDLALYESVDDALAARPGPGD